MSLMHNNDVTSQQHTNEYTRIPSSLSTNECHECKIDISTVNNTPNEVEVGGAAVECIISTTVYRRIEVTPPRQLVTVLRFWLRRI